MKNLSDLGEPLGRLPCQIEFSGEEHGLIDQLPGFKSCFQYSKTRINYVLLFFYFLT